MTRRPEAERAWSPPVALTVAGSDSGGGAGIQADLRTFAALGVFATTAVTAVTAQNTVEVRGMEVIPAAFVDAQIAAVLDDLEVRAVKTGMLATADIVDLVADRAGCGDLANLVVDPVMVASSGDRLLDADAERSYLERLFPVATVVTPNLWETSLLVGGEVADVAAMEKAAARLGGTGARCVVVKGGHLDGDRAVDVMWLDGSTRLLSSERAATRNVHGTGCTFSAAIAAHLARGLGVADAVEAAKAFVSAAIEGAAAWRLGSGHGPIDHLGWGTGP